jgi:uncharacterized membrane protein
MSDYQTTVWALALVLTVYIVATAMVTWARVECARMMRTAEEETKRQAPPKCDQKW